MIAKVEVRRQLALYEQKIKDEIKKVENEIVKMDIACATVEMMAIWKQSKEYAKLNERRGTLIEVLWGIRDIRCDEMLEDKE